MEITNRKNKYNIIFTVVFAGILLSFSVFFLLTSVFNNSSNIADGFLNGNGPRETLFSRYDNACLKNREFHTLIKEVEYTSFANISSGDVLGGKNGFIFNAGENKYGYKYIEDYKGSNPFDADELEHLYNYIEMRQIAFENYGCVYLLAVIPNAQTVYSENMPNYLGDISGNTALSSLSKYMSEREFESFVDLTDALLAAKSEGDLYNNTENSLNSLGAFYAYEEIMKSIPRGAADKNSVLSVKDFKFTTKYTDGKTLAQLAGLSSVIKNKTVSLASSTVYKYTTLEHQGDISTTYIKYDYIESIPESPSVLVETTQDWDKVQLMPYFSGTFSRVSYRSDTVYDRVALENADPEIVIQLVREDELRMLLESGVYSSYSAGLTHGQHPYETMEPSDISYMIVDGKTLIVTGSAADGEEITIFGDGLKAKVVRAADGRFSATLEIRNIDAVTELCLRAKGDGKSVSDTVYIPIG